MCSSDLFPSHDMADLFGGVALDEGSILKNPEGAYRNMLIKSFIYTPFKSVWTATPSPNDPMEIGSYSEFLDVMPYNEMQCTLCMMRVKPRNGD